MTRNTGPISRMAYLMNVGGILSVFAAIGVLYAYPETPGNIVVYFGVTGMVLFAMLGLR